MVLLATTRQRFRTRLDGMQGELHRFNDRPQRSGRSEESTQQSRRTELSGVERAGVALLLLHEVLFA
jgi:hypothetical protein